MSGLPLRIGTAGWNVPSQHAERMSRNGSHLERYSDQLNAVEINTSFHRPHQRKTYERWARTTPAGFSFSVKVPKAITHDLRLANCDALLDRFLAEVTGLGDKLGVLLVQLPPSFSFDKQLVGHFFRNLHSRTECPSVLEPRHSSWFATDVEKWLVDLRIPRVAADPPPAAGADKTGGCKRIAYYRWHGSPRIYFSEYDTTALARLGSELSRDRRPSVTTWCIFDNTAAGAALGNALELASLVQRNTGARRRARSCLVRMPRRASLPLTIPKAPRNANKLL